MVMSEIVIKPRQNFVKKRKCIVQSLVSLFSLTRAPVIRLCVYVYDCSASHPDLLMEVPHVARLASFLSNSKEAFLILLIKGETRNSIKTEKLLL